MGSGALVPRRLLINRKYRRYAVSLRSRPIATPRERIHGAVGERIHPFVAGVAAVAAYFSPTDLMPCEQLIELFNDVTVLDGIAVRGLPPSAFPPCPRPVRGAAASIGRSNSSASFRGVDLLAPFLRRRFLSDKGFVSAVGSPCG